MLKKGPFLAIFIALLVPLAFFFYFDGQGPPPRPRLPRLLPLADTTTQPNKVKVNDTLWHTIPPFSLQSQSGRTITSADVKDKVYVANFFFATCPTACPRMTSQLARVQREFVKDTTLRLLSHTVDPERDTVAALREFATRYEADSSRWFFLTGNKADIYRLARKGYKVVADDREGGADDFVHSEKLVLVDKQGVIWGYYEGLDSTSVNQLMIDIRTLQLEYQRPRKEPMQINPKDSLKKP